MEDAPKSAKLMRWALAIQQYDVTIIIIIIITTTMFMVLSS